MESLDMIEESILTLMQLERKSKEKQIDSQEKIRFV